MSFNVGTVQAKVGADTKPFGRAMGKVRKMGAKTAKQVGQKMRSIGTAMTAGITAPLVGAGAMALKTAADYEKLRTSMNVLNKSVEEGARNFERLKKFSAGTPFQLRDLAEAQNMLQGFGQSADDAFESVKMIGDIAAVASGDIKGIGIAFGQAAAEGKLMTRDIRQLINQGVPAIKLLADTMNVAESEVFDLASQGEISFDILQQAFRDATSEGGMFADGMKKQANTLSGVWSTLKDNFSLALGEIGDSMAKAFNIKDLAKSLISNLQAFTKWFSTVSDEAKRLGFTIAAALGAAGPALIALGTLSAAIGALLTPIGGVIAAVAGIGAAFVAVAGNWEAIKERLSDISWWRNAIIDMIQFLIENQPWGHMIDGLNAVLNYFGKATIPNPFRDLSDKLEGLKVETKEYEHEFKGVMGTIKGAIENLSGIDIGNIFGNTQEQGKKTALEMANITSKTSELNNEITGVPPNLSKMNSNLSLTQIALGETSDKAKVMGQQLQSVVNSAISNFATTLGNVFTGDAGASGFFNNLLMIVADFTNQFGKLLVGAGTAALAFENLLTNPVAAIAAGAALIAASTAVKNLLKDGPSQSVNDALITSGGKVVEFHPDDNILAMKDFGKLGAGGQQRQQPTMSYQSMKKAFQEALRSETQRLGPNEVFAMNAKGSRGF